MHEFALLKKLLPNCDLGLLHEKKWRGEHTALADAARACRCFFALGIVIGLYFEETKTAHYTNEKK